jgi:hypothetical protein
VADVTLLLLLRVYFTKFFSDQPHHRDIPPSHGSQAPRPPSSLWTVGQNEPLALVSEDTWKRKCPLRVICISFACGLHTPLDALGDVG